MADQRSETGQYEHTNQKPRKISSSRQREPQAMLQPPVHPRTRKKAAKNLLFAQNSFQHNYLPPDEQPIRATCAQNLPNKRVYDGAVAPGLRVGRGLKHNDHERHTCFFTVAPGLRVGRGLKQILDKEKESEKALLPAYGSGED